MLVPWKKSMTNLNSILKKRHQFVSKGSYSQSYGFSSSHVQMWELNHKEVWRPTNWCLQIVVLEKTLESLLDHMEMKLVSPKGNLLWIFIGRTDAKAEAPILWPLDWKSWLTGKDPDTGKDWAGGDRGWDVGWHHQLNAQEFEKASGDGEGQGSLVCCSAWGCKGYYLVHEPHDPAIPFLGIYLDKTIIQKDTCTTVLTAALFRIARTWKQLICPSTEQIKKIWYACTMEYSLALKKEWNNAICSNTDGPTDFHTKWSKSDRGRQILYDTTCMWSLKKNDINELIYKTETVL